MPGVVSEQTSTDVPHRASGKLVEGDTVPSARRIAAGWGIALATATKALNALRA